MSPTLKRLRHAAVYVVTFLVVWNVFELVYEKLIRQNDYRFDAWQCLGRPALFGLICWAVYEIMELITGRRKKS